MTNEKIRFVLSGISATGIQADAIHDAIDLLKEYEDESHEYTKFKELVEAIAYKMCDSYCKYTEKMFEQYKEPDDAQRHLEDEHCRNCPFDRLFEEIYKS